MPVKTKLSTTQKFLSPNFPFFAHRKNFRLGHLGGPSDTLGDTQQSTIDGGSSGSGSGSGGRALIGCERKESSENR